MESSVFIGVVDNEEMTNLKQCHWNDNRIGGHPLFGPSALFDNICCSNCSRNMAFIFQISCPVDSSSDDRVLYFFACGNLKCSKKEYSIFRILTNSSENSKTTNENLFEDEWATPIDEESELSVTLEQNLSLIEKCSLSEECIFFKPHYISVFEEPNKEININKKEKENLENLAKSCLEEKDGGESYEKNYSGAFKNDKTNYQFYKRLRRCPEQIIRYNWLGQPLYSTCNIEVKPDPCQSCGSPRVFELQLMPALVSILSRIKQDQDNIFDLEFETILIYTCGSNCNRQGQKIYKEQMFLFKEILPNTITQV